MYYKYVLKMYVFVKSNLSQIKIIIIYLFGLKIQCTNRIQVYIVLVKKKIKFGYNDVYFTVPWPSL